MTDKHINIAKLLYAAYPDADLLPIDPDQDCYDLDTLLAKVTEEDIGDSLFRFMVVEIVEGGESTLAGAIRVITRARADVQAVLEALQAAQSPQPQHPYEVRAAELLEAFKTLVSYTSDLLYQMDNQVNLEEIDPLRQAKAAIVRYESKQDPAESQEFEIILKELSPDLPRLELKTQLLCEYGKVWIRPEGFGDAYSMAGDGWPIGLELWQGRLRLLIFSDINNEEPQIIDLEKARESNRIESTQEGGFLSYCAAIEYLTEQGQKIFTGHLNGGLWNARCLDAYRLSKKQSDKAAYAFLLKFGDQYAQGIDADTKETWQKIKESAAAMLNA